MAEAATTLWMAIMLPAAAPTDCSVTIIAPETPIRPAALSWNCDSIRFDTVLEPAMKAPNPPTAGAKNG
ncbi:hypothetical protein D3C84_1149100 [compost metagenome]